MYQVCWVRGAARLPRAARISRKCPFETAVLLVIDPRTRDRHPSCRRERPVAWAPRATAYGQSAIDHCSKNSGGEPNTGVLDGRLVPTGHGDVMKKAAIGGWLVLALWAVGCGAPTSAEDSIDYGRGATGSGGTAGSGGAGGAGIAPPGTGGSGGSVIPPIPPGGSAGAGGPPGDAGGGPTKAGVYS